MDAALLVSPHLDDAVLSAGQFLAGRPAVTVLTMFAGHPKDPTMLTDFDRWSGFVSAAEALLRRHREDRAALGSLRAFVEHAEHVDNQYRPPGVGATLPGLVDTIDKTVSTVEPAVLFGPVGLAHPDHLAASDAVIETASAHREIPLWLYEEQPARVLWPEQVPARLATIEQRWPVTFALDFPGTGDLARKRAAIEQYRSQLWALDLHACLVPERFWLGSWHD